MQTPGRVHTLQRCTYTKTTHTPVQPMLFLSTWVSPLDIHGHRYGEGLEDELVLFLLLRCTDTAVTNFREELVLAASTRTFSTTQIPLEVSVHLKRCAWTAWLPVILIRSRRHVVTAAKLEVLLNMCAQRQLHLCAYCHLQDCRAVPPYMRPHVAVPS